MSVGKCLSELKSKYFYIDSEWIGWVFSEAKEMNKEITCEDFAVAFEQAVNELLDTDEIYWLLYELVLDKIDLLVAPGDITVSHEDKRRGKRRHGAKKRKHKLELEFKFE